jgi:hypothetical protein
MNDNLKALIEQTGMTLKPRELLEDDEPNGYHVSDLDHLENNLGAVRVFFDGGVEKLCNLIIKECMDICDKIEDSYLENPKYDDIENDDYAYAIGAGVCYNAIASHFGEENETNSI